MRAKSLDANNIEPEIVSWYFKRLCSAYNYIDRVSVDGVLIDYSPRETLLIEAIEKMIKESENRIVERLTKK